MNRQKESVEEFQNTDSSSCGHASRRAYISVCIRLPEDLSSPRVLFIGLDETDDYAHHASYDHYLQAAHDADKMIASLWQWIQSDPQPTRIERH